MIRSRSSLVMYEMTWFLWLELRCLVVDNPRRLMILNTCCLRVPSWVAASITDMRFSSIFLSGQRLRNRRKKHTTMRPLRAHSRCYAKDVWEPKGLFPSALMHLLARPRPLALSDGRNLHRASGLCSQAQVMVCKESHPHERHHVHGFHQNRTWHAVPDNRGGVNVKDVFRHGK